MRTTIEMTDDARARLLEIAGARGEKGFSRIVQEAIEFYLEHHGSRRARQRAALALEGSVAAKDGAALEETVRSIRASWR
jgi:hypothetical protein